MERRAERGWEANTSGPTDRQTTDRHAMWMEMRRVETCARAYAGDVFGFRLWVLSSSEDIWSTVESENTEIGKKAWLFAKLQPGTARKKINAT